MTLEAEDDEVVQLIRRVWCAARDDVVNVKEDVVGIGAVRVLTPSGDRIFENTNIIFGQWG
jgi:hypothetical protein